MRQRLGTATLVVSLFGPFCLSVWSNSAPVAAQVPSQLPGQLSSQLSRQGSATIEEIQDDIRGQRVSRRQHLERRIDNIQHSESTLKAFIDADLAGARKLASDRDTQRAEGIDGPLDGIVIAIKDNLHTSGFRTTAGSNTIAALPVLTIDADVVARVRGAGAIIVGTTNLDTVARGVRGVSEVRGQTANPRDPRFNAGGSSAGSAAAVSSGMVDVALGSDTCGSLRYPASSVGIFALRPTWGIVSRNGVVPLSPSQDTVGPMAARATDLRVVLNVIRDEPAGQPTSVRRRLGVLRGLGTTNPAIIERLRRAGFEIVDAGTAPSVAGVNLIEKEAAPSLAAYTKWRQAGGEGEQTWLRPSKQPAARGRLAKTLTDRMNQLNVDALIMPTNRYAPVRLGARQPSSNCMLSAGSGLPALTIGDATGSGLPPIGVDLLGRPNDDDLLIDVAIAIDLEQ